MQPVDRVMPLMSWEREALGRQIESAIDNIVIGSMFSRAEGEEIRKLCQKDDGTVRVILNRGRADEKACTPAWYAIDNNKYELLPYVLGPEKLQHIPPAFENGWHKQDLVQAMAAAEGGPARTDSAIRQVMACLDVENPEVADQVWRIAVGLIDHPDRHKKDMFTRVMRAAQILSHGGVPKAGVTEYERLLESTVLLQDMRKWPVAACLFSSAISPTSVMCRMLDGGLSPNHRVANLPLLSYAAVGNADLIDKLLDLGADIKATCPAETCRELYNLNASEIKVQQCTAADLAEAARRFDHAAILRAAAARQAINNTLEQFGIRESSP